MMKSTEIQQHNRYTAQDIVCDAVKTDCTLAAAYGLLSIVGSF
jgi:hypothetical protein